MYLLKLQQFKVYMIYTQHDVQDCYIVTANWINYTTVYCIWTDYELLQENERLALINMFHLAKSMQ